MKARRANPVTAVLPQEPSLFWLSLSQSRALPTAALVASSILTLSSVFAGGAAMAAEPTARDRTAARDRFMTSPTGVVAGSPDPATRTVVVGGTVGRPCHNFIPV